MAEQRINSRRSAAAHNGRKKLRRTVSIIRGFSMHDSMWTLPSYELPRELACEDLDEDAWSELELDGLAEHNRLRAGHKACPLRLSRRLCQMAAGLAQAAASGGNFRHSERELRQFYRGVHAGEAIAYRVATRWGGVDQACLLTGSEAARMWYDECADPGYNFNLAQPQDGTGHFTQLIWRATRLFGVASATQVTEQEPSDEDVGHRAVDDKGALPTVVLVTNVVVALYFPPGNVDKCFEENVLQAEKPVDDVIASVEKPADDVTSSVEKSVDDDIASVEKPVDDVTSTVEKPADDVTYSVEKSVDDVTTTMEKPVDDVIASVEKPADDVTSATVNSIDDVTIPMEEPPTEYVITSVETSIDSVARQTKRTTNVVDVVASSGRDLNPTAADVRDLASFEAPSTGSFMTEAVMV